MKDRFFLDPDKKHCIRSLAALSGLTYHDIADYLGSHPVSVCKKMNAKRSINIVEYKKIMKFVLGCAQQERERTSAIREAYEKMGLD